MLLVIVVGHEADSELDDTGLEEQQEGDLEYGNEHGDDDNDDDAGDDDDDDTGAAVAGGDVDDVGT